MAITLTSNYKEILSDQSVKIVDSLVDQGHNLVDILTFADIHGEDALLNFEQYNFLKRNYGEGAIEAFQELFRGDDLSTFENRYLGHFYSLSTFAEDWVKNEEPFLPDYLDVNWHYTGENILLEEGIEAHNNHYFKEK